MTELVTPDRFDPPNIGERVQSASPGARRVHQAILRHFAATGAAPDPSDYETAALTELHERDLIRLDDSGAIVVAYPFSGTETPHRVHITDGASAWSMCAIDALGIAAMLDQDIAIESTDPHNRQPIRVDIHNRQATWTPSTTVVFVGVADCCHADEPSVDRCCGVLNFFTTTSSAAAWHTNHPDTSGQPVDQATALRVGTEIFGSLLTRIAEPG
ncbi:alkylmercury lyase family protein [Stackebrandtia nassauensis]|uniref:Alkylmercury lyase n=1 Tax=Stackebrandtia nassauensis (strain DSM 44728 / CIP 108903 / NRRL B-16338 / NBRC 102104 / LLR-40K-21) TaxID=446470 RepID=D3PUY3_STANL|nr:alkylmercury lyase family protein [Stackebrandtia nassauensis]ADD45007.1 alkylmercury lyase [Stackebrandtia nassauensis DSM 44728]